MFNLLAGVFCRYLDIMWKGMYKNVIVDVSGIYLSFLRTKKRKKSLVDRLKRYVIQSYISAIYKTIMSKRTMYMNYHKYITCAKRCIIKKNYLNMLKLVLMY